ncbi:MAG: hypothetical protein PHR16_17805 [Methylovulum sp.]|nr:hypothetical protein [Methylovulum sp.]
MYGTKQLVNRAALHEATTLLSDIDNDPYHPVNDVRHTQHLASIAAYCKLQVWVDEQNELLAKERRTLGLGG